MTDSYIRFVDERMAGPQSKTKIWDVESTSDSQLGQIRWYTAWRCYCFFPMFNPIFNSGCLIDIAKFCYDQTENRKKERQND